MRTLISFCAVQEEMESTVAKIQHHSTVHEAALVTNIYFAITITYREKFRTVNVTKAASLCDGDHFKDQRTAYLCCNAALRTPKTEEYSSCQVRCICSLVLAGGNSFNYLRPSHSHAE